VRPSEEPGVQPLPVVGHAGQRKVAVRVRACCATQARAQGRVAAERGAQRRLVAVVHETADLGWHDAWEAARASQRAPPGVLVRRRHRTDEMTP
jgi:hypothetical protein